LPGLITGLMTLKGQLSGFFCYYRWHSKPKNGFLRIDI
jgi:hypothetical protein